MKKIVAATFLTLVATSASIVLSQPAQAEIVNCCYPVRPSPKMQPIIQVLIEMATVKDK